MLIRLKQLVNSVIIVGLSLTILSAKEIPITQEVELTVPLGKFSVVEFPFKIEAKNIASFLITKELGKDYKKSTLDNIMDKEIDIPNPNPSKRNIKPKKKKSKNISIKQNTNGFTFFAKKTGVLKMVVWGYKHPILLTIKVSKKNGFRLYQFVLPQSDSELVRKTEEGNHEKNVNYIMVNLFNQTLPRGYKSNSKDVTYQTKSFSLRLNRQIVGRKYLGQEWILTSKLQEKTFIHEESFYQKGIYGVSLEADSVDKNESIRVFIVRANSKKKVK